MTEAATEPEPEAKKKGRRYATVLVSVPGWPTQDPGRLMLYSTRSTPSKAARMIKRLRKQLPEFVWSQEMLSDTEARLVKLKPFKLTSDMLARPVTVVLTGRTPKVITEK